MQRVNAFTGCSEHDIDANGGTLEYLQSSTSCEDTRKEGSNILAADSFHAVPFPHLYIP